MCCAIKSLTGTIILKVRTEFPNVWGEYNYHGLPCPVISVQCAQQLSRKVSSGVSNRLPVIVMKSCTFLSRYRSCWSLPHVFSKRSSQCTEPVWFLWWWGILIIAIWLGGSVGPSWPIMSGKNHLCGGRKKKLESTVSTCLPIPTICGNQDISAFSLLFLLILHQSWV